VWEEQYSHCSLSARMCFHHARNATLCRSRPVAREVLFLDSHCKDLWMVPHNLTNGHWADNSLREVCGSQQY
jgi:hypothetical protein